ncbi:MAG: carboxylating nicotinate-nucleotide diphosphorylase, partial [Candidatus Eremiobacteraeota bacterium]|nr:carboxylating nicotinate-nucleotide diphosphorylase [Candidatus Eremiobacteraeota bacterium]
MKTAVANALAPLPRMVYEPVVRAALVEDFGLGGDLTSEACVPSGARAKASLVARAPGVLAGLDCALAAFSILDPNAAFSIRVSDGEDVAAGTAIARIECDARALLGAERPALNLLSHLSGIATATARYVVAAGGRATIAETRKTLPGLRALQKYAVRAGGGANHRFRLDDAILIKDNHIALAGGVAAALDGAHARAGHLVKIEIEVDTLAQLDEVLAHPGGADVILLDNFSPAAIAEAVSRTRGRALLEASGGIVPALHGARARAGHLVKIEIEVDT